MADIIVQEKEVVVVEVGSVGPAGPQGPAGAAGADGAGVPSGGSQGEYLRKVSGTDNDTEWTNNVDYYEQPIFAAGSMAATDTIDSSEGNVQSLTLTQDTAITIINDSAIAVVRPITLYVTHSGGPWTLSINSVDAALVGASGEIEELTYHSIDGGTTPIIGTPKVVG